MPGPIEPTYCPLCGAELTYEVDGVSYSRAVGVEITGVYDGALFWACPRCGFVWHRFGRGSRLWALAEPYLRARRSSLGQKEPNE